MAEQLLGTPVVPGVALGPVLVATSTVPDQAISAFESREVLDPAAALEAYDAAVAAVVEGLERRASQLSDAAAEVLRATAVLARDKGLRGAVAKRVASGERLVAAVRAGTDQFVGIFTTMGGLMAERATDLRDIEKRVVARLVGAPEPGIPVPTEPSVLVAEDLAPVDTAGLDPALVIGLATAKGGPTSHTAIIARQLGIPCVVGMAGVTSLAAGTVVLLDGETGVLEVDPDLEVAHKQVEVDRTHRAAVEAWTGPGRTLDGAPVKLLANVADGQAARQAAQAPVEGVGLFRTELCFLDTAEEPSVEAQATVYAEVLAAFGPDRKVVVRTLDAGSDKPIAYATVPGEDNPALGVRGLRLVLGNRGLVERQVAAIARAAEQTGTRPWVMAPMVATVAEAQDFAELVRSHGLTPGVMVEVPAAALMARELLEVVDFLSLGTNDLTQYTMAADRLVADLAHLTDAWQPAVLRLVSMTAEAGRHAGKPVGVCGEAAADPALAVVMVGMGVTSLSMAAAAVKTVGAQFAAVTAEQCRAAAHAALSAADPASARAAVRSLID